MEKTIEIVYGNSLKINRGNYEQEAPLYSAKTIAKLENGEHLDETAEYNRLKGIVDPLLEAHYKQVKNNLDGLRIREKDGKKYPSVTTFLSPDPIPIDKDLLAQYAKRGNEYESLFLQWLDTGEVLKPSESLDITPLKWDLKFPQFIKQYGDVFKREASTKIEFFNETHMFSGEIDFIDTLLYQGDEIKVICDVKTGTYKWEQLFAYLYSHPKIDWVAIIDLKNGKLLIKHREEIVWWEKALIKRGEFKSRFSI